MNDLKIGDYGNCLRCGTPIHGIEGCQRCSSAGTPPQDARNYGRELTEELKMLPDLATEYNRKIWHKFVALYQELVSLRAASRASGTAPFAYEELMSCGHARRYLWAESMYSSKIECIVCRLLAVSGTEGSEALALREFKKSVDNAVTVAFLSMTDDLGATDPREAIEHIRREFRDAEMRFQQHIRALAASRSGGALHTDCDCPCDGCGSDDPSKHCHKAPCDVCPKKEEK